MTPWSIVLARAISICLMVGFLTAQANCADQAADAALHFKADIRPILDQNCYDCHGHGEREGQISLDEFASDAAILNHDLWLRVLKNVRAGIMPPAGQDRLPAGDLATLESWIKYAAFGIDPDDPDPGHVTLRRLNRNEYEHTIHDLMGYEYRTDEKFPPDDTGQGFDNIGDVLSTSPLLVEKYLQAASEIVRAVVPAATKVAREQVIPGANFIDAPGGVDHVSCEQAAQYAKSIPIDQPGEYSVRVEFVVYGHGFYTEGQTQIGFSSDGEQLHSQAYGWQQEQRATPIVFQFTRNWQAGNKEFTFHVEPLAKTGTDAKSKKVPLSLRIVDVRIQGPLDEAHWVHPPNYHRFFPRSEPPLGEAERRDYAREVLRLFVGRAFRRPVDEATLERLVMLAESIYSSPGSTFEQGIQQAMTAALSSKRFLFRIEHAAPEQAGRRFPLLDEYSLASRLSYLLWSSMPDDKLFDLARRGELRNNLESQVKRMLADPKSSAFVEGFVGQWLRTREVDTVEINPRMVLARDLGVEAEESAYVDALLSKLAELRKKYEERALHPEQAKEPKPDAPSLADSVAVKPPKLPGINLDQKLRTAMRSETEDCFNYILHENHSMLELIDSDYSFLNERLARYYGIDGIKGPQMRKVTLPADSHRGGVLTHAGVLMITSQSTRTSAVKRGRYVLDNLLGTPAPPAPANVPALEEAEKSFAGHEPTLRETLELHRRNQVCASCHDRMDPIGLALENFNALGMWRTRERKQDIDVEGELVTGEKLTGVADLRNLLVNGHRTDYYRCVAEKLMIYALGRGLEYFDTEAVDLIVQRLESDQGHAFSLLMGVVESAPFQKCRAADAQMDDSTQ